MSTKIYNAYAFKGTPADMMAHLRDYRPKWHQFQVKRLRAEMDEPAPLGYSELVDKIEEQSTKRYPSWNDTYDVRGSIAVYFVGKQVYCQTFLQASCKPPAFVDDRFIDFHYQNQSDPWYDYEETLTKNEKAAAARNWRKRQHVWDAVFSGQFSSAVEAGLMYELVSQVEMYWIASEITGILKG